VTGARTAGRPSAITVEYDCDRQCQVELDLSEAHVRMTLGMMQERTAVAHKAAHDAEPVKAFSYINGFNHSIVRANVGGAL
jgi:hypothetical protein